MSEQHPIPIEAFQGNFFDPASPESMIAADWQTIEFCPLDDMDYPPVIAQAYGLGNTFRVRLPVFFREEPALVNGDVIISPETSAGIFTPRNVAVITGFGGPDAINRYIQAIASRVRPHDIQRVDLESLQPLFDIAWDQGMSLTTLRRHGSSIARVNVDDLVRARGGNPSYRIPKPKGSFKLKR